MKPNRISKRDITERCKALLRDAAEAGNTRAQEQLEWLTQPRKRRNRVRCDKPHTVPQGPPGKWVLWIANWHPSSANKREGYHWRVRKRIKDADVEIVAIEARKQGIKPADRKRRVVATLYYPDRRWWHDQDNVGKALYDALRDSGLVKDDGPRWCFQEAVRQEIGPKGTRVELEDCE